MQVYSVELREKMDPDTNKIARNLYKNNNIIKRKVQRSVTKLL